MLKSDGARIALITFVLFVLVESLSWLTLRNSGQERSFLYSGGVEKRGGGAGEGFGTLDPHLGYAHDRNETAIRTLPPGKTWIDGFVVYADPSDSIERPIIVTLGGSTTDGINYGHSWPEELANMMRAQGLQGTVLNGGTGGYSSSQELVKLIRDGLSFKPDIVISYSGVNDRGGYSVPDHPFVHPYQASLMETLVSTGGFPLFPNTTRLLGNLAGLETGVNFSLGVPTHMLLADRFRMNIEMMHAVSTSQGAEFFSFIQPVAVLIDPSATDRTPDFVERTQQLYAGIAKLPSVHPYITDATRLLDPHVHYKADGVHVTPEGDRVIAGFIFDRIRSTLRQKQP